MIWQEPAKGGYPDRSFLALPGEERMGAARRGLIPYSPMGYLTELEMTEGSHGHSTFSMPASPWFANSSGLISGGVLALIGDAALGSVIHSHVGPGQGMTTAELSMSFLRPVVPKTGTAVTGSGQLIHRGRSLGISEAFLFDDDDQLVSHGTTRCTVFPPVEPEEGQAVVELPCSKWLSTSAGTIQGGFTAMLAESAMTSAAFSTAPADTAVATLDFKVNYLRPVFPDGNEMTARARILHRGRTLIVAAAELTNPE